MRIRETAVCPDVKQGKPERMDSQCLCGHTWVWAWLENFWFSYSNYEIRSVRFFIPKVAQMEVYY